MKQGRPPGNRKQGKPGRPTKPGTKRVPAKKPEQVVTVPEVIRLNRFLSNAGVCSRREADTFIQEGLVKVNGKVVTELGTKVSRSDEVRYRDKVLRSEVLRYILLNKPKGYITTMNDEKQRRTVMELIKGACPERVYPVGRLDRNTTGLLLLTNDGELTEKMTHPSHGVSKMYHVLLDKPLEMRHFQAVSEGVDLEDGPIKVDRIAYVKDGRDPREIGLEIHSGRNRIVRRIFEKLGYDVIGLDRVKVASLTKKDLPRGTWRFLTEREVNYLKML